MTDKDKGAPAHSVTHTDMAKGQGGGARTMPPGTLGEPAKDENAKDAARRDPGQGGLPGADPDDVAQGMGTTGKDLGFRKD